MVQPPGRRKVAVFVMLLIGAGIYAGMAFSMKATDQAEFCGSCHVMYEYVRTHQMSAHAQVACNECHAPDTAVPKMMFKAQAGSWHMYKNTFGGIADVIHAQENSREVINQSCTNCHTMTNLNVADSLENCTDCHRSVPHMSKLPISQRRVANE
ncbi:cytochrome c3 family protein [Desulfonatronum thioautotrophicum]|uniref:cytochrome c3 family protein n=1 Tax=Desulfonatronum thioautotrophicum TaxID=617001 RepID=UPI0005EB1C49|nr:NapC/NirT family cytochrome c [Desulfonatronum thioautotrophicum]